MHTEVIKDIVADIRSLEPFPEVASTVLELSVRDDIIPNELIDIIQTDPGITAKLLKLCNSAFYGFQREIASLREAGNLLGVTALVSLVLTSSANRYFRDYGNASTSSQVGLWRRCVASALASRLLARYHGETDPERAYTAGLLQNLGHLVLDRFVDDHSSDLIAALDGGSSLIDAERNVLGLSHAEISARLATRWGLPEVLVDTIRHHHAPENATIDPTLTATIHLAETLTWSIGLGDGVDSRSYGVSSAALAATQLRPADFAGLDRMLTDELERARSLIEG